VLISRGRPVNKRRRQQIVKLRTAGLTLNDIGERLGRQRVQFVLKLTGNVRFVPIHCRECGNANNRALRRSGQQPGCQLRGKKW